MNYLSAILDLATVSIRAFDNYAQRKYESRIRSLRQKISNVEDSDFYKKDMEAKGKAERELYHETMLLKDQIIKEANK